MLSTAAVIAALIGLVAAIASVRGNDPNTTAGELATGAQSDVTFLPNGAPPTSGAVTTTPTTASGSPRSATTARPGGVTATSGLPPSTPSTARPKLSVTASAGTDELSNSSNCGNPSKPFTTRVSASVGGGTPPYDVVLIWQGAESGQRVMQQSGSSQSTFTTTLGPFTHEGAIEWRVIAADGKIIGESSYHTVTVEECTPIPQWTA